MTLKNQALKNYANNPFVNGQDGVSDFINSSTIKATREKGITYIRAECLSDPAKKIILYANKKWSYIRVGNMEQAVPITCEKIESKKDSTPLRLSSSITEKDPEPVELLSNENYYKDLFETAYRFPFADSSKRYYFDKQGVIYSGLTGVISSHPLFDKSYLAKVAHQRALEDGINVYTEWSQAADYGTLLHTFISMHEILDTEFKFSFDNPGDWLNYVKEYCNKLGYSHLIPKWCNMIQNDMAAWFAFKKERNVKVLLSEVCVKDTTLGIMTPIDIVCELDWDRKRQIATINLKSGKSISYPDIKFQSYVESLLFNQAIPDATKKATVSLLWRPKERDKKPCEYEISVNLIDQFSLSDVSILGYIVKVKGLNKPKGVILNISGGEENLTINKLSAEEYVTLFLQSKTK